MVSRRDVLIGAGAAVLAGVLRPTVAEAAPAIQKFGTSINFARNISGKARKLSLAARPGGGLIALWERDTGETRTSWLRFYDAGLRQIGSSRKLTRANYSAGNEWVGQIVPYPSGSVNVVFHGWIDNRLDLLWLQRFTGAGAAITKPASIAGSNLDFYHALATRLSGGNMLTAWMGGGFTYGKVLKQGGTQVAYNAGSLVGGTLVQIAPLPTGGAVAAYVGPDTVNSATFQLLSPNGARVGTPKKFPADYYGGMTVAAHPQGFVGVWKFVDDKGMPHVDGAIFSSTGAVIAKLARQALRPSDRYRDLHPAVLSLPDGRIVVVADSVFKPSSTGSKRYYQLLGYLFGANGARIAPRVTLYSKFAEFEIWDYIARPRAVVRLADGTFVLGYDGGQEFGIEEVRGIRFRVTT